MRITPKNILRHELIGLYVRVLRSKNRSLEGIEGRVIDETMKTLVVETKTGRRVVVPKSFCEFVFRLPDGTEVLVVGKYIMGRPENRLKKRIKSW